MQMMWKMRQNNFWILFCVNFFLNHEGTEARNCTKALCFFVH